MTRRASRLLAVVALLVAVVVPAAASASLVGDPALHVVTFDGPPTPTDVAMLEGVADGVHAFVHVPAAVVLVEPALVDLLEQLPGVGGVWANTSMTKLLRQSTRTVGADHAWDVGWTGEGVGIAVIDTGIDGTHPDLCAAEAFCQGTPVRTVQNVKILGRETRADPVVVLEDQLNTDTSSGHGTHVAGIAAGAGVGSAVGDDYRGVAPGAHLIGLSTGEAIEAVNVLAAFDWVIEHHEAYDIKVVNNSWGPGAGTPHDPAHPVNRAIAAATDVGVTVVFGAGNAGPVTDTMNAFSVDPNALSVAGGTKEGHVAFFSSRGVPGSDLWRPDVTAPGWMIAAPRSATGFYAALAGITSPNPDPVDPLDEARYVTSNGTSMAAPHVAGVVALVQQAAREGLGRWLTPAEVRAVIQHTAVRDGDGGPGGMPNYQPYTMGAGYVDAAAATEAAAAGEHLAPWDDGLAHDVRTFTGTVGPAAALPTDSFETTIDVLPGARSLDVMVDWELVADDVDLDLYRPDGSLAGSTFLRCAPDAEPNGYSSFCSQIANERITATAPVPGTWRAVVRGGLVSTSADVVGAWSVAYPDGTAVPRPAAPAAVTVAADPAPAHLVGQEVVLTASVVDADGAPVPGAAVTWSTAGDGEVVSGEDETHLAGWATARLASTSPGVQTVTVTAGAASATIDVAWLGVDLDLGLGTPASSAGRVNGAGWWATPDGRVRVGVAASYEDADDAPAAELVVRAPDAELHAEGATWFTVDGDVARMGGPAILDGDDGYQYELTVTDGGNPGRDVDEVHVEVTHPLRPLWRWQHDGVLDAGNLHVRDDG